MLHLTGVVVSKLPSVTLSAPTHKRLSSLWYFFGHQVQLLKTLFRAMVSERARCFCHCCTLSHLAFRFAQASSQSPSQKSMGPALDMPSIRAILVLDNEGNRIATRYYDSQTFADKANQVRWLPAL